jgi:hypothetical protein
VWRPRKIGSVIAERRLKFAEPGKRGRTVSVRFGQPVRASRPGRGDPWWCPVGITGLGKRSLRPIAGEDSVQAIVLAFEFVTHVLPLEAERAGGYSRVARGARTSGVRKHSFYWAGQQSTTESHRGSQ